MAGEMNNIHENSLEPAQFLIENVELLPKSRVLDVAMGSGRNSIYLAKMGFNVESVDNLLWGFRHRYFGRRAV